MAQEVRFHGSSTVTKRVMEPAKEAIAKATGINVTIVGNGTENGLEDLFKGRCNASMASETLPEAIDNLKKVNKDVQVPSDLQGHTITSDIIAVIVNPKNSITKPSNSKAKTITNRFREVQQMKDSMQDIQLSLSEIQMATKRNVILVAKSRMNGALQAVSERSTTATEQQSSASEDVAVNMEKIHNVTLDLGRTVSQIEEQAESLTHTASTLDEKMKWFKTTPAS